jgi:hypothetical protein
VIPGHRSEICVPKGVQGKEGDKLDFRVWLDENGLLGRYGSNQDGRQAKNRKKGGWNF